jgi:hypothetical protein
MREPGALRRALDQPLAQWVGARRALAAGPRFAEDEAGRGREEWKRGRKRRDCEPVDAGAEGDGCRSSERSPAAS